MARRHQAVFWTNAGILLIWPLKINVSEILIEIITHSFKKMHLKKGRLRNGHLITASMRWKVCSKCDNTAPANCVHIMAAGVLVYGGRSQKWLCFIISHLSVNWRCPCKKRAFVVTGFALFWLSVTLLHDTVTNFTHIYQDWHTVHVFQARIFYDATNISTWRKISFKICATTFLPVVHM